MLMHRCSKATACFGTDGNRSGPIRFCLVVDGPIGRVRSRIVVAGMRTNGLKATEPKTFIFLNLADPKILSHRSSGANRKSLPRCSASCPRIRRLILRDRLRSKRSCRRRRCTNCRSIRRASNRFSFPNRSSLPPPRFANDRPSPKRDFQQFPLLDGWRLAFGRDSCSWCVDVTTNRNHHRPELGETVIIARGGVTVLIRDVTAQLPNGEFMELGTISLSADRVVGWLPLVTDLFNGTTDISQAEGELYLEGDIVFRQGERIIYAESMYYNINAERGMVLDAEAITTIPDYQGIVRLKADVLQQVARGNFIAFDAAVTSSRMGVSTLLAAKRTTAVDRSPADRAGSGHRSYPSREVSRSSRAATTLSTSAASRFCTGQRSRPVCSDRHLTCRASRSETTTSSGRRCCSTLICFSCLGSRMRRPA